MRFYAEDHIKDLNELRTSLLEADINLTEPQFRDALKRCGIPSNKLFWNTLKSSGLIKKINGEFNFSNPKNPIHFKALQNVYSTYYKKYSSYTLKQKAAEKLKELKKAKEIEAALKLLREKGFEIYMPIEGLFKKI